MKKPSMIKRFFSFLLRTLVVIALMIVIAAGSFEGVTYYLTGSLYDLRDIRSGNTSTPAGKKSSSQEETAVNDKNTKYSLFYVESEDELSRYASLIMTNTSTKSVDILLIPLHVQVTVGGELLSDIQKHIPNAASTLELDNIARAYGDDKYRIITEIFGQIFSVNVSEYDVMSQKQFKDLLNITNPVNYHFTDMMSYRDSKQELKYIPSGDQMLDGKTAVILMTHMDGTDKQESARLERTNTYLETWIDKVLSEGKGGDLIDQIEKNAAASEKRDRSEEKKIWAGLDPEAVTLRILQGSESGGLFAIDSQKARLQIATLIKQSADYNSSDDTDSVTSIGGDDEAVGSSKDYYIELYNAAFRQGLASEWERYLEEEGYNISLIDSYQDEGPLSTTRIVVSQEGIGQDLLKYFPGADIQTGEIATGGDIRVYIGTDNASVEGGSQGDSTSYNSGEADTASEETEATEESTSESENDTQGSDSGNGYYNFDTDTE